MNNNGKQFVYSWQVPVDPYSVKVTHIDESGEAETAEYHEFLINSLQLSLNDKNELMMDAEYIGRIKEE